MDLDTLRQQINALDDTILQAFTQRMEVAAQIAAYKAENGLPIYQAQREQAVIDRLTGQAPPALSLSTAALFTAMMDISKCRQREQIPVQPPRSLPVTVLPAGTVGCQGTQGSNSEQAAKQLFPDAVPVFYAEFEDVFRAVERGEIAYGILPVQNSTTGTVARTYELMRQHDFSIVRQTTVRIHHCLAARPGIRLCDLQGVCSHPQALRQCGDFLRRHGFSQIAHSNTATAAQHVSETADPLAAICAPSCAALYGLEILAEDIADCSPNFTRFLCISKDPLLTDDADCISVALSLPHQSGSLFRLLTKFYTFGLDLLRLESRPLANGSFDVIFYLDFAGNVRRDPKVASLLAELSDSLTYCKYLGNYAETDQ